ncbi:YqiA/YcfP family alpha/beta fold hydrolase [Gynuella sunshinyii]|nr:YqiA/YcfP family alpha/beta fold hydrolase [Gynuella sunshinyii]
MKKKLVFLHGFLSSPDSEKAQILRHNLHLFPHAVGFEVPQIPLDLSRAQVMLADLVVQSRHNGVEPVFIGSSLGGFFAWQLAAEFAVKAVLVNPAVQPDISLQHYPDTVQNPYTGETLHINQNVIETLKKWRETRRIPNKQIMLVLQTGDEVLDYRDALSRFPVSQALIQPRGSHRFEQFETTLPAISHFLNLNK